jgi:hypothetical protein
VAGSCECIDEPSGSGATELVKFASLACTNLKIKMYRTIILPGPVVVYFVIVKLGLSSYGKKYYIE